MRTGEAARSVGEASAQAASRVRLVGARSVCDLACASPGQASAPLHVAALDAGAT